MLQAVSQCLLCGAPVLEASPGINVHTCACSKRGTSNTPAPKPPPIEYYTDKSLLVEALSVIKELVAEECTEDKGNLSSNGKFVYAKAIKFLEKNNSVQVISQKGPVVKASWI